MVTKIYYTFTASILITALAAVLILYFAPSANFVAGMQDVGWKVYVKTSPCSGRFDWVLVAQQNPTGRGGLGYWQTADLILSGTPMRCVREGSQCTKAAAEAEAVMVRASSRFRDYCCKEYSVWKQQQTGKWTIVVGKFGNPGPGWFFEDGPMCCEEAEEITGLTGACSGNTGKHGVGYIGCYKDTSAFDLDGFLQRSSSNTPQSCIATCRGKGFAYAAVQYGQSCLCGNSYGKYGKADNCNMPCTGDKGQFCGGYSANSVYSTGAGDGPKPPDNEIDLSGSWYNTFPAQGGKFDHVMNLSRHSAGKWVGTINVWFNGTRTATFDSDVTIESLGGGRIKVITSGPQNRVFTLDGTVSGNKLVYNTVNHQMEFTRR
jgi:hypothetical protein